MTLDELVCYAVSVRNANFYGVLSVYWDNSVQLNSDLFVKIAKENNLKINVIERVNTTEYPYEISFKLDEFKFFIICEPHELTKILKEVKQ